MKKAKSPATLHYEAKQRQEFQNYVWSQMVKAAAKGNARRARKK